MSKTSMTRMTSLGSSDLITDTEYGNLQEVRYPEVEGFDQLCANLKLRLTAMHEGDLKTAQHLYCGIVVLAYDKAKAKVIARKPPDCEEPTNIERGEWRSPEWKRFRFNHGEISRLMRKWRGITFKELRRNSQACPTVKSGKEEKCIAKK